MPLVACIRSLEENCSGKGRAIVGGDREADDSGKIGPLADKRTLPWLVEAIYLKKKNSLGKGRNG